MKSQPKSQFLLNGKSDQNPWLFSDKSNRNNPEIVNQYKKKKVDTEETSFSMSLEKNRSA